MSKQSFFTRIFFNFLRNVLKQTKISTSVKRSEKQLPSKVNFSTFCHLIAISLGQNSVKALKVNKIVKEIKFLGVSGELE